MKKLFIVANWKSNKTIKETEEWLHDFDKVFKAKRFTFDNKEIIIAPTFTSVEHANYCLGNLKLAIKFAAQNISPFDEGAYTGEVNGQQIKELADYVIIGHSERRRYFGGDEKMVNKKIKQALKYELVPILCVSDIKQIQSSKFLPRRQAGKVQNYSSKLIVAYEPLFAIGSGNPDTPENANNMAAQIKRELSNSPVLYGGSVTSKNVSFFTRMKGIDGVLVGGASLDAKEFLKIIENA